MDGVIEASPRNMYHTLASQVTRLRDCLCDSFLFLLYLDVATCKGTTMESFNLSAWCAYITAISHSPTWCLCMQLDAALFCGRELGLWACLASLKHGLLSAVDSR
eukprot:scaffold36848_cov19-Tisochrysis_lutea.AAC.2